MNLYLILYGLVSLAVLLVGVSTLNGMGMSLGAGIYGVGALAILFIYGMRWFGSDKSILSNTPVPWPPVMNTCPDFLTYYKRKKADGVIEETCIDTIGVSKNGGIKPFPVGKSVPTDEKYYFSLKTTKSDVAGRNQELCQRAIINGLTWEGITNGESCIRPDGKTTSPSSGSSSGCPA